MVTSAVMTTWMTERATMNDSALADAVIQILTGRTHSDASRYWT
jgi:hypothetical protein